MPEPGTLLSPDSARDADPPRAELPAAPGVAYFSAMALPTSIGILPGDDLVSGALWVAYGGAWAALTCRLLRPLGKRRPSLAGQIHAALLVVPGMSALIGWDYSAVEWPVFLGAAALFSGLMGLLLSQTYGISASSLIEVEAGRSEG